MKTVGELREFLETLNDDMPIVKTSLNFELRGAIVNGVYAQKKKYSKEVETFIDTFDYTEYKQDVYKCDNDGIECLYIF